MCRRTRQIVAFTIGDRSANTCRKLWNRVAEDYRACSSFSDFWEAYREVLPDKTHIQVGKGSGEVNHMERWNCTLRQWLGRFTRKTLSFSKADYMHHLVTRWFIVEYNLKIRKTFTWSHYQKFMLHLVSRLCVLTIRISFFLHSGLLGPIVMVRILFSNSTLVICLLQIGEVGFIDLSQHNHSLIITSFA